ncbi:hypothetical protein [Thalassobaculum litoreum]|uniref:hypothetical protein n=1 Tax=Thalassobaculum litoreum TaxID=420996 RepID=UPI00111443DA|nr:hypothetical protein [Thalassobaculum litoreum]
MSRDDGRAEIPRARLNFGSLDTAALPSSKQSSDHLNSPERPAAPRLDPTLAATAGVRSGFGPRSPETKIDGRRLRGKGRTQQLNVKVTPDFHATLLLRAQEYGSVADYLEYLLSLDGDFSP